MLIKILKGSAEFYRCVNEPILALRYMDKSGGCLDLVTAKWFLLQLLRGLKHIHDTHVRLRQISRVDPSFPYLNFIFHFSSFYFRVS